MILQLRNAQNILEKQLQHLLNQVLDKAENTRLFLKPVELMHNTPFQLP